MYAALLKSLDSITLKRGGVIPHPMDLGQLKYDIEEQHEGGREGGGGRRGYEKKTVAHRSIADTIDRKILNNTENSLLRPLRSTASMLIPRNSIQGSCFVTWLHCFTLFHFICATVASQT